MNKTKKEIEETMRCKLQRKFNEEKEYYRERIEKLAKENRELQSELHDKNDELIAMKDKVDQYEDWIRRLQEFCNMPEGEREKAIEAYKADNESKLRFKQFMSSPMISMFSEVFNYGF